jgi:hypothetical protein
VALAQSQRERPIAAPLMTGISMASAETCSQRADNCVTKGGGRGVCNEPSKMASCETTGKYVAPSGTVWPATIKQKK